MSTLEPLIALQERDVALDVLHHRRANVPARTALEGCLTRAAALAARIGELGTRRDELARDEQRLDDEVQALQARAAQEESRLYSGEVASPRELQALQADVDQLRHHQRELENRELALMEQREPVDAELAGLEEQRRALVTEVDSIRQELEAAVGDIDAEVATEQGARDEIAAGLEGALLAEYERCRARANGVGAARLVGTTCQGCHLTIPSTEAERIKRADGARVEHCDNCGCILVP